MPPSGPLSAAARALSVAPPGGRCSRPAWGDDGGKVRGRRGLFSGGRRPPRSRADVGCRAAARAGATSAGQSWPAASSGFIRRAAQRPPAERVGPVRPRLPVQRRWRRPRTRGRPCRTRPARCRAGRGGAARAARRGPCGSSSKCASSPSTSACPEAKKSIVSSSTAYSRSKEPTNDVPPGTPGRLSTSASLPNSMA